MHFRKATLGDAPRIAAWERAYIECPWSESVVRQTIEDPNSVIYLLYDGDEPVGYGGMRIVLDTAEVYNIAVDAAKRRRGYGARITRKLVDCAQKAGATEVLLEVSEHNEAARRCYETCGFSVLSVRKGYYASGNALVMRKAL